MMSAYHIDPKFLDRQAWANSVDQDGTAPTGAVRSGATLFAIPSAAFEPYSVVKLYCFYFRIITAIFSGVRIFRTFTVFTSAFVREQH